MPPPPGFGVWVLGFGDLGSGYVVWDLVCGIWGLGLGSGYRGLGFGVLGLGSGVWGRRSEIRSWKPGLGFEV